MSTREVSNRWVAATHKATQNLFPRFALGAALAAVTLAGCNKNPATTNPDGTPVTNASDPNAQDPTLANSAPVDNTQQAPVQSSASHPTQVAGYQQQAQPTQQSYSNAAPIERRAPSSDQYANQGNVNQGNNDQGYDGDYSDAETGYNATLADVSAPQPPPPLPVYEQPEAPDPNYLWTPGYWNYAPQGYYWVPGAWVQPPYTGALWTPGYWGGYGSGYRFHRGFWAAHIGFYGGINYGFGYGGSGYQGGYWNGDNFYYNRAVNRVNENVIHNVYQRNVIVNNVTYNNISYNGGRGGVPVQPRPAELAVLHEQRVAPMHAQIEHQQQAAQNRQQFFSANQGRPAQVVAASPLVADRGIPAPAHTTAQLNRSVPVAEQIRQQQQFVRPANNVARPANQPAAVQQNRMAANQPNRALQQGVAAQSASRTSPQPARTAATQQQNRPVTAQQEHTRPVQQQQARSAQQQQAARPEVQTVRPQTPQQGARPQSEARPQTSTQPHAQAQQARPEAQPQSHPGQQPQSHPEQEPHAAPHTEPHPHR